ncbi:MAG: sodium:solute symporter family protein [Opitutaceae bacterium]|jgi:SSS family transporter|nr:sodium:solute symporter family protein [Opitutaceae bacterium]
MHPILYSGIVVLYVLLMLAIGWWCMRRSKSVGDFYLGGRALGPWMSAFAYGTTYFSAVLFIGYAGKLGWGFGIHTMWIVIGNTLVGTFLAWKILAARTRDMTVRLNALTMPEFLSARYGGKTLRVVAALVVFVFLVPYSASVLMGLSYMFEMTLRIPYEAALVFLALLTAVYLVMGGYFAVAVSDFFRGIIEFGGVMLMVWLLAHRPETGGFVEAARRLLNGGPEMAPALAGTARLGQGIFSVNAPGWLLLACLVLITSFGPWALPQMVQKFYSIRRNADINRAVLIASVFALFMSFGAYFSGALAHLFYDNKLPAALLSGNGTPLWDKIMPHFITTSSLPAALVLVIVLMVFSASMSSLSSLVLVSSSSIAIDFCGAFGSRHDNPRATLLLLRVLCVVFVAASLFIALKQPAVIVNLMVMSWGALAGVFLAPYLYGLFWKRATRAGALAGMAGGLAATFTLFPAWGGVGAPLAGAVTMLLPLVIVPVVSLLTPPPPPEQIARAFGEKQADPPPKSPGSTASP